MYWPLWLCRVSKMLRCVERYKVFGYGDFAVGDIIDDAELEPRLLRDSPSAFEVVQVEVITAAPEAPPEDKMVKRARK
jgi:hypothetical protein